MTPLRPARSRVRRSKNPSGGGWHFPNTGGGSLGPGANAPVWSGKTTYPEELFTTPIPVHYASENSAGFKGWQGFDGSWGGTPYTPTRSTYPVVSTPLGTKPVLEVRYPGSLATLSAAEATTTPWGTKDRFSVRVYGTWSGALVFERSLNAGATWTPISLRGGFVAGVGTSPSGSTTMTSGIWSSDDNYLDASGLFRVRATSWTSGEATVTVGMQGGEAPARMSAGLFTGTPTRIYTRVLVYVDEAWFDGPSGGTKFFFTRTSQADGHNHYIGVVNPTYTGAFFGTQFNTDGSQNRTYPQTTTLPNGQWCDLEFVLEAGTPGVYDGVVRAWGNGAPMLARTDVQLFLSGVTPGFTSFFMDPTYGGGEGPPPRTNFFRIAGWYRESAP